MRQVNLDCGCVIDEPEFPEECPRMFPCAHSYWSMTPEEYRGEEPEKRCVAPDYFNKQRKENDNVKGTI